MFINYKTYSAKVIYQLIDGLSVKCNPNQNTSKYFVLEIQKLILKLTSKCRVPAPIIFRTILKNKVEA